MTAHPPWTITTAGAALRARDISATDLLNGVLARLHETESRVHAYAFVAEASARAAAHRVDAELARGSDRGPLHGIPIAIKDVIAVAGLPLEAGCAALRGRIADHDAEVVKRLQRAGAVVTGKTVTHELAYGQNTPPTRNAHDHSREPGGSSAGSAVATAIGSALAALGTDGGGSTRHPAALNGIVGLKPTYGLIPMHGVLSIAPSLDHVGICARTVNDCALMVSVLADNVIRADPHLTGARIGVLTQHVRDCDADVRNNFFEATRRLQRLGAVLVEIELAELEHAVPVALAITMPEATGEHGALLHRAPHLLHPGTRAMLAAGAAVPATDYVTAHRARLTIQAAVRHAFETASLDAIASPSMPATAGPARPTTPPVARLARTLRLNMWANVTGLPAITVPSGRAPNGLPLALQFTGRPRHDAALLSIAAAFEYAQDTEPLPAVSRGTDS